MRKAFVQLHIAILLAGLTGILGRLITLNEAWLVWYRLLISATTMFLLFYFTGSLKKVKPGDMLRIAGVGAIAALHWISFFGAIKYSNVSVALVCFSSVGFFTSILEPVITKRRIIWMDVFLGLLVMLGIYIIFHFDGQYQTGILIGIISAALGAVFPIFNRQFMQRMNAATLMSYELAGGWITVTLLLPFYENAFPSTHWWPSQSDWVWLLVLSWLCSVWAFQLSANALKKISAFTVNISYNLEPVYGILLAFALFQENKHLDDGFYIGLVIILAVVLFQSWRIYRSRASVDRS